jgi:hypothetical protein
VAGRTEGARKHAQKHGRDDVNTQLNGVFVNIYHV